MIAAAVGNFILPALCRQCGDIADGETWAPLLCRRCEQTFPFAGGAIAVDGIVAARAFAEFEGAARRLLIDLKYGGITRAGRMIGAQMAVAPAADPILRGADLIVPIPLHWLRRWRRGHNQAGVLARAVVRARGEGVVANVLRRTRATPPQVGLERQRRIVNVGGAFRVKPRCRDRLRGATVVIIDDVVTTGATARAAAAALREAAPEDIRFYAAAWAAD